MYLVDTNAISEQRKANTGKADANVERWFNMVDTEFLFLSVVSIREMESGVQRMEHRDKAQGRLLRQWLEEQIRPAFDGRVLPVTMDVAIRCAGLFVPNPPPIEDAYIAATALVHGLTVVTRNTADFASMGVKLINPWEVQ
jgi:toxin FitB